MRKVVLAVVALAFLPKGQVGSDYLDGHSNFVVQ